jgi:hypothetical protein
MLSLLNPWGSEGSHRFRGPVDVNRVLRVAGQAENRACVPAGTRSGVTHGSEATLDFVLHGRVQRGVRIIWQATNG